MTADDPQLPVLQRGMRVTIGDGADRLGGRVSAAAIRRGVAHYTIAWDSGSHGQVNGTAVLCLQVVGSHTTTRPRDAPRITGGRSEP